MASSSLEQQKAMDDLLSECLKQNLPVYAGTELYTGIAIVLTELLRRTKPNV